MEAIYSSEISVDFKGSTSPCILEDSAIHNHRCENIKSYNWLYIMWNNGRIVQHFAAVTIVQARLLTVYLSGEVN
jgi:hypothetical protein